MMKARELHGILTRPDSEAPYPSVILLQGSDRSSAKDPYYKEHAENLIRSGFAVLRYDESGGGGGISKDSGFETLEYSSRPPSSICDPALISMPAPLVGGESVREAGSASWLPHRMMASHSSFRSQNRGVGPQNRKFIASRRRAEQPALRKTKLPRRF